MAANMNLNIRFTLVAELADVYTYELLFGCKAVDSSFLIVPSKNNVLCILAEKKLKYYSRLFILQHNLN